MTRRDYVLLSGLLFNVRARYAPHWDPNLFRACDDHARALADALAAANPNGFDRARFLADCGVA